MTMKKSNKTIVFFLCAAILMLFAGCSSGDYSSVLQTNWGFELPDGCELIYQKDSGASFHGDGFRYHVYSCADTAAVSDAFEWTDSGNTTVFYDTRLEAAAAFLDELGTPENERTDFSRCLSAYYSQEDSSEAFLFFDSAGGRLYIIESFL